MANALRVGDRILERLGARRSRGGLGPDRGGRVMSARTAPLVARRRRAARRDCRSRRNRASPGPGAARFPGSRRPRRRGERAGRGAGGGDGGIHGGRHGPVDRVLHRGARFPAGVATTRWRGAPTSSWRACSASRMRVVRLRLGRRVLQLTEYLAPRGRPAPADSRSNDRWFQHVAIIVSDMDSAYARLRRNKVQHASTGPQLLPKTIPNAAGIRAFYFRDPDGHPLEVLQFPPDKGDPKWHAPSDRLFLGIDHTAIVVSDTRASLAFYRDVLGLPGGGREHELRHRAGAPEQRARRPAPHHRPARPGRPGDRVSRVPEPARRPALSRRRARRTTWCTGRPRCGSPTPAAAAAAVRRGRFRLVSPAPVELPDTALGFRRGVLVRDPDGHAVQLVEHEGEVHAQH